MEEALEMTTNDFLQKVYELEDKYGSIAKVPDEEFHPIREIDKAKAKSDVKFSTSRLAKLIKQELRNCDSIQEIAEKIDLPVERINFIILRYDLKPSYIVLEDMYRDVFKTFTTAVDLFKMMRSEYGIVMDARRVDMYIDTGDVFKNRFRLFSADYDRAKV